MTKQEHMLMMSMFAVQFQLTNTLANILKSREIATDDDLHAFADLTVQRESEAMGLIIAAYEKLAQSMGVTIPETPSPSS
jgi:hypothetical protein